MGELAEQSSTVPAAFLERLEKLVGAAGAQQVLATMAQPKRAGFWLNPLRPEAEGPRGEPIPGLPGCRVVAARDRDRLNRCAAARTGRIYPVNPSSVLAVLALRPQSGEEVLDLAAAPGGKTLLMAAAMDNTGRIAAVEPVPARFHRLRANLERCGAGNVDFYQHDGRTVGRKVPGRFDAVLLDAPCSSEARFRLSEPPTYAHWTPRKVRECARKQRALARSAYAALKPGGRLVYCTCAFAPEENEAVVNHLLRREPGARVVELNLPGAPARPLEPGRTAWAGREFQPALGRARRVVPDDLWDGFFVCRIEKPP